MLFTIGLLTKLNHSLRGKDGAENDFMCLTMIDPASSWFEIVEVSVTIDAIIPMDTKGRKGTKTHKQTKLRHFDESSPMISNLVNKTWFCNYPHYQYINYGNESELNFTTKICVNHLGSSLSQTLSRTQQQMPC